MRTAGTLVTPAPMAFAVHSSSASSTALLSSARRMARGWISHAAAATITPSGFERSSPAA